MRQGLLITLGFVVLAVAVTFIARSRVRTAEHGAFSKLDLASALKTAEAASPKGLVVADFSAEWCGPCQTMLREAWSDERVQRWLSSNQATAVLIDVDANGGLAQKHDVRTIPLIIVFRGSAPIARLTGAADPAEFVSWLESAKAK